MPNYPFWMGGLAASMSAACTHPLDLAKVRMQTVELAPGKQPSFLYTIRATVQETGVRGLYVGLSASILRQMSYSLVRIGSYEKIKGQLQAQAEAQSQGQAEKRKPSRAKLLLAAAAAGGIGGVAGNPADILLVRMTSDSIRPPDKRYGYSNALTGLYNLIKEEGFQGLTRGLGANTIRAILMNASQVGSYDLFKAELLGLRVPVVDYQFKDNLLLHTVASCCAGTVATTICAPADVIKSRLMSSSEKANPFEIISRSLREEGPKFLFKGWTPAFIRLGPNTVLLFVFFEQLKKAWDVTTS